MIVYKYEILFQLYVMMMKILISTFQKDICLVFHLQEVETNQQSGTENR